MIMLRILFALILTISYPVYAETHVVEINITDHKFDPAEVKVPAGKRIKLIVKNNDSTIEEFESEDLKREKIIAPGRSANIILPSLKPGEYKFEGEFHADTAQGVLIVE